MNDQRVLCLDIGGSSVKSGVFSLSHFKEHGALIANLKEVEIESRDFDSVKAAVLKATQNGLASTRASSLGISTTGSVRNEIVLSAGHFRGYEMIDWPQLLRGQFPILQTVRVANDGKASAWAEYSYFGSNNCSHVHFVLGTGVGSSVVVNGQLIDGDSNEAGFLGHTRVTTEPTVICSCDRQGCLETVASAPGLVFEYNKRGAGQVGDFADFQELIRTGDSHAAAVVEAACDYFGDVISTVVNALNPKTVTFGGGVMLGIRAALLDRGDQDYFLSRIKKRIEFCAFERSANTTNLKYGAFDNDGGLVGAALLATA